MVELDTADGRHFIVTLEDPEDSAGTFDVDDLWMCVPVSREEDFLRAVLFNASAVQIGRALADTHGTE